MFCVVKSAEGCKLLYSDTDSVQEWDIEKNTYINTLEKYMITFGHKISNYNFL